MGDRRAGVIQKMLMVFGAVPAYYAGEEVSHAIAYQRSVSEGYIPGPLADASGMYDLLCCRGNRINNQET